MLASWWEDIRYAARLLARQPGFSLIAILLLGLGIGANSAIFSLVDSVLLKPAPYHDLDRLYYLTVRDTLKGRAPAELSVPEFAEIEHSLRTFSSLGAMMYQPITLTGRGEPLTLMGVFISRDYLETLGVEMMLGRRFVPSEFTPQRNQAVILSNTFWRNRCGSDAAIVGQTIRLEREQHLVVGVLPELKGESSSPDVYLPLPFEPDLLAARTGRSATVVGHLAEGATPEQAAAELLSRSRSMAERFPESNLGQEIHLEPLMNRVRGGATQPLTVLSVAVGLVLLIACANLASLLLVRGAARQRELAIRSALGASQWRVFRQMLVESLMLALAGGAAGLALAAWCVRAARGWGALRLPRISGLALSPNVVVFTFGVAVAAGVLFGIAPALQALRTNLSRALGEESRGSSSGSGRGRLRALLVVGEVALSVILLVSAGLLLRTYVGLTQTDAGFRAEGVLSMRVMIPMGRYPDDEARRGFVGRVVERLRTLPGVSAAGGAVLAPLVGVDNWMVEISPDGSRGDARPLAHYNAATPGYFRAIGAQLLLGREFSASDDARSTPVVIINESLARKYYPRLNPLGRLLGVQPTGQSETQARIIGVVKDIAQRRPGEAPAPMIFQPHAQRPWPFLFLVLKTPGEPARLAEAARRAVFEIDSETPLDRITPLARSLERSISQQQLAMVMLVAFATLAMLLATIGLYGVLAVAVAQRGREIGIRMALGATSGDILRMVLRQGGGLTLAGLAAGLVSAPLATQALRQMLYGVQPYDALTFVAVAAGVAAAGALACLIPARRAARVDAGQALRE
jgi:putative ABC transport system permease protein